MKRYVIGIDEAGRGPLAGPVSVAVVAVPEEVYKHFLRNFKKVKDSKKLTESDREIWLKKIKENDSIISLVSLVGNEIIDRKGIVYAISLALKRSLKKTLLKPEESNIFLDGSLKAPIQFKKQRTIIRGDESIKIISAASIVAKVHRDRYMKRKALEFPNYNFEIHKGYGTKLHIQKIKKYGISVIHRKSFLKNL